MKRAVRAVGAFLADWRNGATLIASVLTALLIVTVVDNMRARSDSTDALKAQVEQQTDARRAATRRIDKLQAEITRLNREVAAGRDERGQLAAAVAALAAQIRQAGGQPVITTSPTAGRAPAPTTSSRPRPRPTPTPTRSATPSPSPTATCHIHDPRDGRCLL